MSPRRFIDSEFTIGYVFNFDLVVLWREIQIVIASDDDGFCLDCRQRSFEIMLLQIVGADISTLPGFQLA